MPDVYQRYPLDTTGTNPDNFISAEEHQLENLQFRFVIPKHGPFYSESVVVMDAVTNQPLIKTSDDIVGQYTIPVISQEATLKMGLEVADAILITDRTVASRVYVSYQTVGGYFQKNTDNIVNIFNAYLNDNRRVDWVTGLYGKPTEFPPSTHAHSLMDVFGFETMTFMLERINQAILLGNTPAFQMILDAIMDLRATREDVDNGIITDKIVSLEVLQHATQRYNFNNITLTPMEAFCGNGGVTTIRVRTTDAPTRDRLYWTIEHVTTRDEDFVLSSGSFEVYRNEGTFQIQTALNLYPEGDDRFRIQLRRGGPDRYVVMTSYEFTIPAHTSLYRDRILDAYRVPTLSTPRLAKTALTNSVNRGVWHAKQN